MKILKRFLPGPPARDDSLDDITVTLAVPEKAAAPEPDRSGFQAGEAVQMAAYSAIGTRKSQQDAVRFAVGWAACRAGRGPAPWPLRGCCGP